MMNIYKLPLLLEPQPEGGYTITCPLLPELITEADSLEDVIPNASDALAAIIEAYHDLRKPLPKFLTAQPSNAVIWTETPIPVMA